MLSADLKAETMLDVPQAQSSAHTTEAPAAVEIDAAVNGAGGIGDVSPGPSPDSALPVKPGHLQHMADVAGIAMPGGSCTAGLAGPGAPAHGLSSSGQSPRVPASRSQHSLQAPESTQMSAHEGAVKTEPAVATTGRVPAATSADRAAAPVCPGPLPNGAAATQSLDSNNQRMDMLLHSSNFGSDVPEKTPGSAVNNGASAGAVAADTAAAGQAPSPPPCPDTLATGGEHLDAEPGQTTRLPGLHAPGLQRGAASEQTGQRGTSDAIVLQATENVAAPKQAEDDSTLLPDITAALPRDSQAGEQHVTERSGSVPPEPSGLSAKQLDILRQLVAQLGGKPSEAQQSASLPQLQQAAPASVDHLPAPAASPVLQSGGPVHQPGLPVDPRPAPSCSLAQTPPLTEHELPAAGRMAQHGRPPQSDGRPQHFFSATRPLPGLQEAPGPETVSAPAMGSRSMPLQDGQPNPQQDGRGRLGAAAADLPGVNAAGLSRQHTVLPDSEADLETGARPKTAMSPTLTQRLRTPTRVRLPTASRRVVAPRPKGNGDSGGAVPSADGAPWMPAPNSAAAAPECSSLPQTVPSKHQQQAPASSLPVPLTLPTESLPALGTATAAGLAPAAEPAQNPQASMEPAAAASDAWLRGLPPAVHQELAAVKQLVLPCKKLKLLADVDNHLYNASKRALCLARPQTLHSPHPRVAAFGTVSVNEYAQHTYRLLCLACLAS